MGINPCCSEGIFHPLNPTVRAKWEGKTEVGNYDRESGFYRIRDHGTAHGRPDSGRGVSADGVEQDRFKDSGPRQKKGAKVAKSAKEVAAESDIIVSMIADGPALEAITFGDSGVAAGIKSGSVFIDMSTVDPESSMRVAKAVEAKGAKMLRAPVSGSTVLAGAGTLDHPGLRRQGSV